MKIAIVILGRRTTMNRFDVEAILYLADFLPHESADELYKIYTNFLSSEFNRPELDIYSCLSRYVGYLLYTGQVEL